MADGVLAGLEKGDHLVSLCRHQVVPLVSNPSQLSSPVFLFWIQEVSGGVCVCVWCV